MFSFPVFVNPQIYNISRSICVRPKYKIKKCPTCNFNDFYECHTSKFVSFNHFMHSLWMNSPGSNTFLYNSQMYTPNLALWISTNLIVCYISLDTQLVPQMQHAPNSNSFHFKPFPPLVLPVFIVHPFVPARSLDIIHDFSFFIISINIW